MKRRDFLKKLGVVCGAAVACPGELLKVEPEWVRYAKTFDKLLKDKPNPLTWMRGERSRHIYFMGQRLYYNEILGEYEGVYVFETPTDQSTTVR